ncbi:MAG TPA: hypothetical protein VEY07_03190 [Thermoplasmata archaeon]|nr:hypothetical protein [Thermoplasmata archaeon]
MADLTERTLGYGFGLLGGLLLLIGGILAMVMGAVDLAVSRPIGTIDAWSEAVILFVVGGLALFFSYLGAHAWKERALASGILLLLVALIGWAVLGIGSNLVALVGAIFVFLSGVLYLLEPAKRVVHEVVAAPN